MARAEGELIDVRPDEVLETARLEPYLREHLSVTEGPLGVRQFGGGHANLTYLLAFGNKEFVLRRPPLGPVAASAHDMKREHRVLSRLSKAFALAPESYLYCDDASLIGADFHVMERRHGFVIRDDLPERFQGDPGLNRRIGEMIVDALASLHKVDAEAAGLADLGRPEGFVERQLKGWAGRWQAAKDADLPRIDAVVGWLERRLPTSRAASLIHNDYKLDNILVADDDPARAVAILDWDMCTRGDPLMDLGYLLNFWNEAGDEEAWITATSMPTWRTGFARREGAIQRYAEKTGFDLADIVWYRVFAVFKFAVVLQQIYVRFLRGQTQDRRFASFGDKVMALADKAADLAGV